MKQVITIQGTPIETYDDSVIQLDYKSNILGEIDKIETCHSYTYAIPNTTKNKALFRLSDVSDSEKKTNQFIPGVELFFNGIKIADGQIYIADVTPDEISIVFLFGMFSALKRIKDDDRKLYELAYKSGDDMHAYNYAMYTGGDITRTPTKSEDGFYPTDFYTFFCWAQGTANTVQKIEAKYFPLSIKIKTLNNKIQDLYKCTISGGEIADNIPEYMMYKPKLRKYFEFSMSPKNMQSGKSSSGEDMYFLYKSIDWEITDSYENVTTQDYNSGDEPFSMTFKADVEITNIRISFATATPFYVLVNIGYPSSYITPLNFVSKEPDVAHPDVFVKTFGDDVPLKINKGSGIAIICTALDGATALNPQGFAVVVNGRMRNTEIASTETTYIDAWSTLPNWSIFDYLTSLAFTNNKRFFINSPTDQNLLQAVSLKEIASNSAKNWSSKIDIDSVKHIYRDDNLAQTNVIQYAKDETLSGEINNIFSYYDTKDSTLDAKKEFFTSKFRHSPDDGFFPPIQNGGTQIPMSFFCDKEPVPGLVTTAVNNSVWKDDTQQYWSAAEATYLTDKDDNYLTYTLMNPHKIEAKFHLNVLDLYEIDFTHPIFLAQFGQIYYIEEIKFNAGESEVTLVELKNSDYR